MNEKKPEIGTIYIEPILKPQEETQQEIRAKTTHSLLALRCEQGLLLYDRRSRSHFLLTWEEMQHPQSK